MIVMACLIYLFFYFMHPKLKNFEKHTPDWILKSKSDSNYWYGVGIAEKSISSKSDDGCV